LIASTDTGFVEMRVSKVVGLGAGPGDDVCAGPPFSRRKASTQLTPGLAPAGTLRCAIWAATCWLATALQ
jgi:hypothetical protein